MKSAEYRSVSKLFAKRGDLVRKLALIKLTKNALAEVSRHRLHLGGY